MYRFKDANKKNNNNNSKESMEASLKNSILINPIVSKQNVFRHDASQKNDIPKMKYQNNSRKKEVAIPEKPYKGKLMKSSLKLIKPIEQYKPIEQTKPKPEMKTLQHGFTKRSTMNFVERLKRIEKVMDKDNLLEQANEEIDIASRQLEEIQKMLSSKMQPKALPTIPEVEKNKEHKVNHSSDSSLSTKLTKQLERLQQQYLSKTKLQYKSLKDVENVLSTVTVEAHTEPQTVKLSTSETSPEDVRVHYFRPKNKILHAANNKSDSLSDTHLTTNQTQTQYNFRNSYKSTPIILEEKGKNLENNEPPQRVPTILNYKNQSVINKPASSSSSFVNKRKSLRKVQFDNIPECPSPENEESEVSSQSEMEFNDDINTFNHIFASRKFKENSCVPVCNLEATDESCEFDSGIEVKAELSRDEDRTTDLETPYGGNPRDILLNGLLFDPDNITQKCILTSDYLSREFPIDNANKFSKVRKPDREGSMQLLKHIKQKFQDHQSCRLESLKRRDQKLHATLNMALQNTLFSEIQR